jgi:hypothetical protein
MVERSSAIALAFVMALIAGLAWRPAPGSNIPPRLSLTEAAPWMADTLPGVGPKSRDQVAEQLRQGHITAIPTRARAMVETLFIQPSTIQRDAQLDAQHHDNTPSATQTPAN